MNELDPFRHHPELRGRIRPAAESYFRDMDLREVDARIVEAGGDEDWRTPDDVREAGRRDWLAGRWGEDLWVFGYGSLMWDPAMEFAEVRRGRSGDFARSFCLWSEGGRGSVERPGLMLAIDDFDGGAGCEGMAFRIEAEKLDHESFVLFRREMIADAYRPVWLTVETAEGPVEAMSFAANHDSPYIVPGIPVDEQARMIATATGFLGSNFDYLDQVRDQLALLGVADPYIEMLHAQVCALRGAG